MGILAKSKGHVYASELRRIKFEEMYLEAWIKQNKKDVIEKPELKIRSYFTAEKMCNKRPLSKNAKIVNNMLSEGKTPKEVAKTLYENVKFITNLITKYNLPRK